MSLTKIVPMTADEFIAWTMEQPDGRRYELVDGEVFAMAPERLAHVRAKQRVFLSLASAVAAAGLACEVLMDGVTVAAGPDAVYGPDVTVRCGPPLPDDAIRVTDPMILVEVLSPSTRGVDTGAKFAGYFRIPSVRHYLIVHPETGVIVHHARDAAGAIASRIVSGGALRLDPPGIDLRDLLPPR